MMSTLKSEFRKLLSVRSTYFITALVLAFVIFFAFYIQGWRLSGMDLSDPNLLTSDVLGALNVTVFGAIVAILLMTHEYRYNTIIYTLTASNGRARVLFAKLVVVSVYALFLAALIATLAPLMSYAGIHIHGHSLAPQTFHVWNLVWRSLFYGWSYGMAGLLVAALLRSQVASIAALFLVPGIAEQLLSLFLKNNAKYLPFTALNQVISGRAISSGSALSPGRAALVFSAYLLIGWLVAWILFEKRDAS